MREWMQRDKEKSISKIQDYINESGDTLLGGILGRLLDEAKRKAPRPIEDQQLKQRVEEKLFRRIKKLARPAIQQRKRLERQRRERALKTDIVDAWRSIARRDIGKAAKQMITNLTTKLNNVKKQAIMCTREARRASARCNRRLAVVAGPITFTNSARRLTREMLAFWRRNEKEEREARKRAEKEALERKRQEEEAREAKRQQRKLNFLLTQTELYGHFIGKKKVQEGHGGDGGASVNLKDADFADVDEETLRKHAEAQALLAVKSTQSKMSDFDRETAAMRGEKKDLSQENIDAALDFKTPSTMTNILHQPRILQCQLKPYQLKGLSWLASLYEQGINGILADEMGLGKTVQAISLLAYLAETCNLWGPFLIITPASTLHNWQQEFAKFVPDFKVLPYWGNVMDRKTLRKFWDPKKLYSRDAHFHVLITSYQLIVADEKYFQRIKWQYMILDEAQAIKSSVSNRWKTLLSFKCRNRLLLTGTPIQNSMQELWALLHFIMPGLFDSHDEFSEWFSKDIESHAEKSTGLDQHQLQRLHIILKPFMLRRVKRDVEHELGEKIELEVKCGLSAKQRAMYHGLREKLPVNLIKTDLDGLMNLVMQFRKVCNHPELFERSEVESPFVMHALGAINGPSHGHILGPLRTPMTTIDNHLQKKLRIHRDEDLVMIHRQEYGLFQDLVEEPLRTLATITHDTPTLNSLLRLPPLYIPPAISFIKDDLILSPPRNNNKRLLFDLDVKPALEELVGRPEQLIIRPDFASFIQDSGKLKALDKLLLDLLNNKHRVLIYSQMTRMIDLLEEYLQHKAYNYLRLDGSTKISDRRDLVNDWQNDDTFFVFLLSTRAGGLGINLTAADTVIFYDSDWNPTVDQQAMDRAHRLGQTKQVTVYRLVTRGTIEERILLRARQKGEIQRVVIAGGDFKSSSGDRSDMRLEEGEEAEVDKVINDDDLNAGFIGMNAGEEKVQKGELMEMLFGKDADAY